MGRRFPDISRVVEHEKACGVQLKLMWNFRPVCTGELLGHPRSCPDASWLVATVFGTASPATLIAPSSNGRGAFFTADCVKKAIFDRLGALSCANSRLVRLLAEVRAWKFGALWARERSGVVRL